MVGGRGFSELRWWVRRVAGGGIVALSRASSLAAYGAIANFMAGPIAACIAAVMVSNPGRPLLPVVALGVGGLWTLRFSVTFGLSVSRV